METFKIPTEQQYFATKEVTKLTGMTKDALRYYERLGILPPVQRDQHNYRQYSQQDLEHLQFIKVFRQLGLNLSLLTKADETVTAAQKARELRTYRQTVHQEIDRLNDIDTFLANKINYFEHSAQHPL